MSWARISGLPDYEFSIMGEVMSFKGKQPRLLSTTKTDDHGYHEIGLFIDGKRKFFRVHNLILLAHRGPPPPGQEGRHFDGNKDNNTLENLVYGTRQQNIFDMVRHGRHRNARKTHCDQGHEFTPENTVLKKDGRKRNCRKCIRRYARDYKRKARLG
jgi:hypothetical protein